MTTCKTASYKRVNNFENHLKTKSHLENIKYRLENFPPAGPASVLSTASAMPPPPIPPLMMGLPDNTGSTGGVLDTMIANVVHQSTGPLTEHIRNLEKRIASSESTHKYNLEEMARQLDESENRGRDLFSKLEEYKLFTERISARLVAAEAGSTEQMELSRRLKALEQASHSLQLSKSSHTAQLKQTQSSIKALEEVSNVPKNYVFRWKEITPKWKVFWTC
jgi:hypothetical protein